jgi:hypothetical protein
MSTTASVNLQKSILFLFLSLCSLFDVHAISIGVPKGIIESAIVKKFPFEKYTVTLDQPVIKFKKEIQKIEICGRWLEKITRNSGDFCLDTQPIWNKSKGDIEIKNLNVLKLTAKDVGELPTQINRLLNTSLLTLLDGTPIYHVPDMVGKLLENVQIEENSLTLVF